MEDLKEKNLPHAQDLWKQLQNLIENDIHEAQISGDINSVRRIEGIFRNVLSEIEEDIEDIQLKNMEHRAKVLSKVFEFITAVDTVETLREAQYTRVRIISPEHHDQEFIMNLMEFLNKELNDINLDFVMGPIKVVESRSDILFWNWVI